MLHYLCRWLKTFNVKTASNIKQREVAAEWSGKDTVVEETPFRFQIMDNKGHYEIKTAPWGYIKDLMLHVTNLLDCLSL